jgi:hypothetical protein
MEAPQGHGFINLLASLEQGLGSAQALNPEPRWPCFRRKWWRVIVTSWSG